jgi:general secretion pathway protein L
MNVLHIFLAGDGACDWTLQDDGDDGGRSSPAGAGHGENTPYAELPRAARSLSMVPAARMRTLTVSVPPTPTAKLSSVVRFALEDQLAGDVESQHVVIAAKRERDAIVHVIDKRWLKDTLAGLARHGIRPALVAAESDLAPRAPAALGTWVWREDGGFLIEAGGRVTVLDQSRDALPSGLLLALRTAGNAGDAGGAGSAAARVVVRGPPALAERSAAWSRATGVTFDIEPEWTWRDASASAIAAAANLLTPELHAGTSSTPAAAGHPRILRRALLWLLAALLLHAGASAAEWAMLKWRVAQVERDTQQLIKSAAPDLAGELDSAWRKHYAAARHRQGKTAPDDALPLLAEAAAALPDLPPGALRVINFEAGQLTLDFDRSAAGPIAAALPLWQGRGLSVLQAESPGGLRVRFARQ